MVENNFMDNKSLKSVEGRTADFGELAKDCVAFANAKGGILNIGIEDGCNEPPANQRIAKGLPEHIIRRINELTYNVYLVPEILSASNGGEYIKLEIKRSQSTVASTTKGVYYLRDDDKSRVMLPDELSKLFEDKPSYCWETKVTKIPWQNCDQLQLMQFVTRIRRSDRVSDFVKQKTDLELLDHYMFVDENGYLTNLGILWVGTRQQRGRLLFAPVVQYIKFDNEGNKVDKRVWDDYSLNPEQLLESIWNSVPDWKETYEISEGLWRKSIPAYDEKVVREILCNSIAHRPYSTRGDIFINLYPDRMVVVNPGQLPYGVTSANILQKTVQRNEHLAKVMYDLHLMEKEGSGYDLMYETLLSAGKAIPQVYEGTDSVQVSVSRRIVTKESARIFEYVTEQFTLNQKNLIALGLVMQAQTITAIDLSKSLQLQDADRLRGYVDTLRAENIVCTRGRGKGVRYFVNPELINNAHSNIPTTLKTIEPYRLKALIQEDLRYHPWSRIGDISSRLPDVEYKDLKRMLHKMALDGELTIQGGRKFRKYNV